MFLLFECLLIALNFTLRYFTPPSSTSLGLVSILFLLFNKTRREVTLLCLLCREQAGVQPIARLKGQSSSASLPWESAPVPSSEQCCQTREGSHYSVLWGAQWDGISGVGQSCELNSRMQVLWAQAQKTVMSGETVFVSVVVCQLVTLIVEKIF